MKDVTTTVRLSVAERNKLKQDAACAKMSSSEYIRNLINNNTPKNDCNKQEIATMLCKLYISLTEQNFKDDDIMKEIHALCQTLS